MTKKTGLTHGVHHAGLTVPDLEEAKAFFTGLLGFEQVGERPDYPAARLKGSGSNLHRNRWGRDRPGI